ncbi:hypothetical protein K461DRAFT_54240 [Myriangium duriaei CBS 260.36]|uniref:Zn(2)-C6 fungal-type domain-containing protein n=1 Tax=Myriangium duriaei CBS 260.36 TaxID=1168546 RepID=A0A9P4IRV0_9PEZI|nr:hypothetical protein K461DRAFT_54240 [Myriangium duriaei CBS 260.36]
MPRDATRRHKRSRDGCQTCRLKRLKCDETKPHCNNCKARRLSCPGYNKSLKWSAKHEVFLAPITSVQGSGSTLQREKEGALSTSPAELPISADDCLDARPYNIAAGSEQVESEGTQSSDERSPRQLLQRFYRLSPSTVPQGLSYKSCKLVEYYFGHVCNIYSFFDSAKNPYRALIARTWQSHAPIYFAVQAMAAAHLANTIPAMADTGALLQQRAQEHLRQDLELVRSGCADPKWLLLTLLLLGPTNSWHNSSDLGLPLLKIARSLIMQKSCSTSIPTDDSDHGLEEFFTESLIYWEMLVSFVSGDDTTTSPDRPNTSEQILLRPADNDDTQRKERNVPGKAPLIPHPWTGVTPQICIIVAEVGRLVRQQSRRKRDDISAQLTSFERATSLENQLLAVRLPAIEDIKDTGDQTTSISDSLTMSAIYRCAALLELYRVFPLLLQLRLTSDNPSLFDSFYTEIMSFLPSLSIDFCAALALHTIKLFQSIPSSSGTCFQQLLPLMIAAAELRCPDVMGSERTSVVHARAFVMDRLAGFACKLPAKPIAAMVLVLQEVWSRLDLGMARDRTFWVDVMHEKGRTTLMG